MDGMRESFHDFPLELNNDYKPADIEPSDNAAIKATKEPSSPITSSVMKASFKDYQKSLAAADKAETIFLSTNTPDAQTHLEKARDDLNQKIDQHQKHLDQLRKAPESSHLRSAKFQEFFRKLPMEIDQMQQRRDQLNALLEKSNADQINNLATKKAEINSLIAQNTPASLFEAQNKVSQLRRDTANDSPLSGEVDRLGARVGRQSRKLTLSRAHNSALKEPNSHLEQTKEALLIQMVKHRASGATAPDEKIIGVYSDNGQPAALRDAIETYQKSFEMTSSSAEEISTTQVHIKLFSPIDEGTDASSVKKIAKEIQSISKETLQISAETTKEKASLAQNKWTPDSQKEIDTKITGFESSISRLEKAIIAAESNPKLGSKKALDKARTRLDQLQMQVKALKTQRQALVATYPKEARTAISQRDQIAALTKPGLLLPKTTSEDMRDLAEAIKIFNTMQSAAKPAEGTAARRVVDQEIEASAALIQELYAASHENVQESARKDARTANALRSPQPKAAEHPKQLAEYTRRGLLQLAVPEHLKSEAEQFKPGEREALMHDMERARAVLGEKQWNALIDKSPELVGIKGLYETEITQAPQFRLIEEGRRLAQVVSMHSKGDPLLKEGQELTMLTKELGSLASQRRNSDAERTLTDDQKVKIARERELVDSIVQNSQMNAPRTIEFFQAQAKLEQLKALAAQSNHPVDFAPAIHQLETELMVEADRMAFTESEKALIQRWNANPSLIESGVELQTFQMFLDRGLLIHKYASNRQETNATAGQTPVLMNILISQQKLHESLIAPKGANPSTQRLAALIRDYEASKPPAWTVGGHAANHPLLEFVENQRGFTADMHLNRMVLENPTFLNKVKDEHRENVEKYAQSVKELEAQEASIGAEIEAASKSCTTRLEFEQAIQAIYAKRPDYFTLLARVHEESKPIEQELDRLSKKLPKLQNKLKDPILENANLSQFNSAKMIVAKNIPKIMSTLKEIESKEGSTANSTEHVAVSKGTQGLFSTLANKIDADEGRKIIQSKIPAVIARLPAGSPLAAGLNAHPDQVPDSALRTELEAYFIQQKDDKGLKLLQDLAPAPKSEAELIYNVQGKVDRISKVRHPQLKARMEKALKDLSNPGLADKSQAYAVLEAGFQQLAKKQEANEKLTDEERVASINPITHPKLKYRMRQALNTLKESSGTDRGARATLNAGYQQLATEDSVLSKEGFGTLSAHKKQQMAFQGEMQKIRDLLLNKQKPPSMKLKALILGYVPSSQVLDNLTKPGADASIATVNKLFIGLDQDKWKATVAQNAFLAADPTDSEKALIERELNLSADMPPFKRILEFADGTRREPITDERTRAAVETAKTRLQALQQEKLVALTNSLDTSTQKSALDQILAQVEEEYPNQLTPGVLTEQAIKTNLTTVFGQRNP